MIRIAHIVASFDVGGLQKGVVNLINRTDAGTFTHLVLSLGPGMAMAERLTVGEAESLGVSTGERRSLARAIAERIRQFGADVVHTRNWPTFADGCRARRRAKIKAHIHGYHGRDASGAVGFGWKRRIVGKILTRFTDRIVVLTRAMGNEYRNEFGTPRGGMRVIPNGVELPDVVRRRRAVGDPYRVLAVGRLDPVKDYASLLQAFASMHGRGPEDRLVIAGDGPERDGLRLAAQRAGIVDSVEMPGLVRDPSRLYGEADVFVQSSLYEGMSNTIAEAMASGLPVIATAVGGNPDVVGDAGILYRSGDVSALADRLAELRADPDRATGLAAAARARVESEFSYERMVGSYEELYRDVSGRS
ncbi:MAG: hypothetical protein CMJ83_14295 [Planctomycetes bacterium]|nr:hypothetical protein [Planctomycetota bacterium]